MNKAGLIYYLDSMAELQYDLIVAQK